MYTSFYQFLADTVISGDAVTSLVTRTRFEIPGRNSGDAHFLVRAKNSFFTFIHQETLTLFINTKLLVLVLELEAVLLVKNNFGGNFKKWGFNIFRENIFSF